MKPIPRTTDVPIGTYILVKSSFPDYAFEYVGKVYSDGMASDGFNYLHNHTVVGIIDSGNNYISMDGTYNTTPWEDVWIIEKKDYAKVLARVL